MLLAPMVHKVCLSILMNIFRKKNYSNKINMG